ncbi:pyridoxamine 5'-phosphate oxidase [Chitinophagaceae bacterium IBVUCB2]|nr:pyridoxamine 5'-phosphate oxidase [Chitinophagaceae bacterium IBVUCB2]
MSANIAAIRKNYSQKKLTEKKADANPLQQFAKWWQQAVEAKLDEVNAMTLATASSDGIPSARIVLLKGVSEDGFVFFTNYKSFKGQQLAENPKACLVFFWKELERQVRITGLVEKVSATESDDYFYSRPVGSQLGAAASPQSQVVENREWLDEHFKAIKKSTKNNKVERPEHWGGYRVKPVIIEFWQGRPSRLHDRLQYTLDESGNWKIERLAP